MSYNPNGCDALKLLTVFGKNGLGISILWIINSSKAVVSPFRNLDPLAEPFFRLLRWFPPTRFSSIRSLKSSLLTDISWALPHSLCWNQLYFCDLPILSLTLFEGCSEFRRISHLRYLRLKKSVHLSAKEIHTQTRSSVWEFSLPLQRFVSTNFLTEVILFNNLHT